MLRDYQAQALAASVVAFERGIWSQAIVLPTGCHRLGQPLLMYDGSIKAVEDVAVGMELMGPDNRPRRVLALCGGSQQMVRIRPTKGDPWVVNLDHVLTLVRTRERNGARSRYPSTRGGDVVDVSVREYLEWSKTQRHLFKLFRVAVDWPSVPVPIDPYVLGLLLGDGGLSSSETVSVTNIDTEVLSYLTEHADLLGLKLSPVADPITYNYRSKVKWRRNPLAKALRSLGLLPIACANRFVPACYRINDRGTRLRVLAGLIDSDGAASCGGFDYLSKSRRLADDVAFIARSVGLAAYVRPKPVNSTIYHRVSISGDCSIVPTRIARKQLAVRRQKKDVLRVGFKVERLDAEQYYGFTLDGDGRYLLGDFTVTHNTGKTYVFSRLLEAFSEWLAPFPSRRQKMLVLAHRDHLLDQAADDIQQANPDHIVGIEQGGRYAGPFADIIIASVATLAASNGRRLRQFDPDEFRIVVVDEAHHIPATSYQTVLDYFGLIPPLDLKPRRGEKSHVEGRRRVRDWWQSTNPQRLLLGVTATPARADAIGLEWTLREIVYERSLRWMIERFYLAPLRGFLLDTATDLDGVQYVGGDFKIDQLSAAINTPERNQQTAIAWCERFIDRPSVGFAVDVQHAKDLAAAFQQQAPSVRCDWTSGDDPQKLAKVEQFRRGDIHVLFNCQLLTEGFNLPSIAAVIMARPTTSQSLYMQMIGRGTRLSPGKVDCAVLDVVDVSRRHSLVSLGDLFGLPSGFNMNGADANATAQAFERLAADCLTVPHVRTLDELQRQIRTIDLWAVKESDEVKRMARLSWLSDSATRYHVQMMPARSENGGLVSGLSRGALVERVELRETTLGDWSIVRTERGAVTETIGTADDLASAFARAERWIEHQRSDTFAAKMRDAAWRTRQISEKQLKALQRLRAPGDLASLTRGQASTLLDHYLARQTA